jgi:D-sedoheptulose 7-phosphate isomerase
MGRASEYILAEHLALVQTMHHLLGDIDLCGGVLVDALRRGNKVLFVGNGGSAGDAQHLAAELTGRFETERRALPGLALTVDSSALTAISNDYGFERVFSRQIEAFAEPGDVLVVISTSGNSRNLVLAAEMATRMQCEVLGLLGRDGGELKNMCNASVTIPSKITARIQEMHIMVGHIWCSMIDDSVR